jgi:hypothetical protein
LPGLIDLLPDPELFPDVADLYGHAAWPPHCAPAQIWLDQSRQLKRLVANSPLLQTAHLVAATSYPTIGEVRIEGGKLKMGARNRPGDDTVPILSAAANFGNAQVYRSDSNHQNLPRDTRVINAVAQLLSTGRCDLLPLTARTVDSLLAPAASSSKHGGPIEELPAPRQEPMLTQRDADFFMQIDWPFADGVVLPQWRAS